MIAEARLAATIVLFRGPADGVPEIFVVKRHRRSGFMPNMYVFPGGRLDDADRDPHLIAKAEGSAAPATARMAGLEHVDDGRALCIAAIRETFEEAGVLLARDRSGGFDPATLRGARDALNDGEWGFARVLDELDARLSLASLTYFDHWITPEMEPRRYDTRFFMARIPTRQTPSHDERETVDSLWLTASEAIDRHRAGELGLAPPTFCILEAFRRLGTQTAIEKWATTRVVAPIMPAITSDGGRLVLSLPGDPRAPTGAGEWSGRVVLRDGHWELVDPSTGLSI